MSYLKIILLFLIMLLFISVDEFFYPSLALSPSFPLQRADVEPSSWIDMLNKAKDYRGLPNTNMLEVTYFSDGHTLNSTIWLAGYFISNTSKLFNGSIGEINYGMLIDADSKEETGRDGIDYQVEIGGGYDGFKLLMVKCF